MLLVEKALYVCDFTFYRSLFLVFIFCVEKKHEIFGLTEYFKVGFLEFYA